MIIDQRVIDYAQLLCTATRNDPRVRLGLGPDHAAKIIDQAKQLASDENRTWITPHDIKTVFKTYPRGKMFCVDDAPEVDAVIAHVLNNVAVP
jgi:MoxR-like ATPase